MDPIPENSEIQFPQEQITAAESQTTSEEDRTDPIVIITPSPTTTAVKSENNPTSQANRDATEGSVLPEEQVPTETQVAKNVQNNSSVQEKRKSRGTTTGSVSSEEQAHPVVGNFENNLKVQEKRRSRGVTTESISPLESEDSKIQFHQEQITAGPDPIVIITPSPTTTAVKSENNPTSQANRDATEGRVLPEEQALETQVVQNNLSVQDKRKRGATTDSVSPMDPTLSEEAVPHIPTPAREITPERELTIVITGIKGAGKSTLISILFDKRADIQASPDSITTDFVRITFITKNGIKITIIDAPGIELSGKKHRKQFKRLSWYTENKADIVLHCISVSPGSKFEKYNLDIIKNLQSSFGDPIWKKCIVVFTFSNYAKNRLKDPEKYKQYIQAYADKYKRALKDAKIENIEVKSILDYGPEVNFEQITDNTIIAIPAGDEGADIVIPGFTDHWVDLILKLMIKKSDPECTPDLLKYSYDKVGTKMGGSVGSASILVGGTLGAIAGAAAGTPFFGVGAGPGAVIGGIAGIAVGAVVGVGAGGVTGVSGPSVYHKMKTKAEQRNKRRAQEGRAQEGIAQEGIAQEARKE